MRIYNYIYNNYTYTRNYTYMMSIHEISKNLKSQIQRILTSLNESLYFITSFRLRVNSRNNIVYQNSSTRNE